MADTKTYLKVQWRGETIRSLPFTQSHLIGLKMAQQMPDTAQTSVLFRILSRVLEADTYESITNDYVDGIVELTDLTTLLNDVVNASVAYLKTSG